MRDSEAGASRVAGGILLSRVAGFVREATLAFFFGAGPHADVFRTALRGPNLLQNLLGEQALSASFIPVYSRLLEAGRREEAGRFAGAVFGLLLVVAGGLSLAGVLLAEPLVAVFAAGYLRDAAAVEAGTATVDRYPLAVAAVRLIFPMTGFLVLSAWALGVLNSHRRFFLPYVAPVAWNAAIVAGLWLAGSAARGGGADRDGLLIAACVGALVGGALQFAVQLPLVVRLLRGFRLSLSTRVGGVREALKAFAPLAAGRGAVQLSSYLDQLLASFLAAGALAALGWAQVLYLLPVSLFGLSVAAAELPELSRVAAAARAARVEAGLRRVYFFTVPTFVGYLAFGFLVVGGLYRRGSFRLDDNWLVYLVLCGYTLGLLATNSSRLLQNLFYATGDTRRPARIAVERVALSGLAGAGLMLWLDRFSVTAAVGFGGGPRELRLGALGLAAAAGASAWYELVRLLAAARREPAAVRLPASHLGKLLAVAAASTLPALAVWWVVPPLPLVAQAAVVLLVYAVTYLAVTRRLGVAEAARWTRFLRLR